MGGKRCPVCDLWKELCFFFGVLFFGVDRTKILLGRGRMWLSALVVEC